MSAEIEQLIADVVDFTGVESPELLREDEPIFSPDAESPAAELFYLIGLIGGKEVGKSSLINAIVGQNISRTSNFGEGTGRAIAFAHESIVEPLRLMLTRACGDDFEIVSHDVDQIRRQVLIDLPDIDSTWQQHLQLTRSMLRHLLFPIWIQSVEKYADRQLQELLARVAAGNDPANFIFCLNKADQLSHEAGAADTLRKDFSARLQRVLKVESPRVFLISAMQPQAFDLPELRKTLAIDKAAATVEKSTQLAVRRRQISLLDWLDQQELFTRAERELRSLRDADELIAERIVQPLLEQTIPQLQSDPAYRLNLLEPALAARLSRWPIVNVIQVSFAPVMALIRKNLSDGNSQMAVEKLTISGRSLTAWIATTFAQLRQTNPSLAKHFECQPLWDDLPAQRAAESFSHGVRQILQRQREASIASLAPGGVSEIVFLPLRWLLTIGALLWFPIIQPVLAGALLGTFRPTLASVTALFIPLLGSEYLLHNALFFILYFLIFWMMLRWDTNRRLGNLIRRWKRSPRDSALSLDGHAMRWSDELIEPIRASQNRVANLAKRVEELRDHHSAFH